MVAPLSWPPYVRIAHSSSVRPVRTSIAPMCPTGLGSLPRGWPQRSSDDSHGMLACGREGMHVPHVPRAGEEPRGRGRREQQTLDSAILGEQFYFWTVVLMWLIHAGFMSYEAGVARRKNVMATAMKNILTIAAVTPTFYYFGWWIYNCNQPGLPIGPNSSDFTAARLPGRDPLERRLRPEPDEQHQPDLLPGLPAVLLDDGFDHVGRAARARPPVGVPGARGACSARWSGSSTPPGAGAPAAG